MHLSERYETLGCNFGVNLLNHLDLHLYILLPYVHSKHILSLLFKNVYVPTYVFKTNKYF